MNNSTVSAITTWPQSQATEASKISNFLSMGSKDYKQTLQPSIKMKKKLLPKTSPWG